MSDATAVLIAAFVAAGAALWIGWLQVQQLKQQNQIALLDKRWACVRLVQQSLSIVMREGRPEGDALPKMIEAIQASWFIFPTDVTAKLESIYRRMLDIMLHHTLMSDPDPAESRSDHVKAKHTALREVADELAVLRKSFEPYMHVGIRGGLATWPTAFLKWVDGETPP